MILINQDTKLCDIISGEPNVITVLNRFGICLGVGDKIVDTVCKENSLDSDFFVTILNTFINEDYFPEHMLHTVDLHKIVDYLQQTNSFYTQFQIPNIERHFNLLLSKSNTENNNLELMRKFFFNLKDELLKRIKEDNEIIFPEVIKASKENKSRCINDLSFCESDSDSIEEKLSDLRNMFIIHLTGIYDINLCYAVLFAVISLEKDIKQNNRIRSRLLVPYLNLNKQ